MNRILIIDDEEKSRSVLSKMLLRFCNPKDIIWQATSADEGIDIVKTKQPTLVFLDVEMPEGDGFYFLEKLQNINFKIVFVTAFNQYAIRAIKFAAFDYLLKPISVSQLQEIMQKFNEVSSSDADRVQVLRDNHIRSQINRMAIPTTRGYDFLMVGDIIWLQASGSYTILHLRDKSQIVSTNNLGRYEELLCESFPFLRIHHSTIINLNEIINLRRNKNMTIKMSSGSELEVSQRRREHLLSLISK